MPHMCIPIIFGIPSREYANRRQSWMERVLEAGDSSPSTPMAYPFIQAPDSARRRRAPARRRRRVPKAYAKWAAKPPLFPFKAGLIPGRKSCGCLRRPGSNAPTTPWHDSFAPPCQWTPDTPPCADPPHHPGRARRRAWTGTQCASCHPIPTVPVQAHPRRADTCP